jgi:hypothetical protein
MGICSFGISRASDTPRYFRSYGADDDLDTGNYKYLAPPEQYLGPKMSKPPSLKPRS